MGYACMAAGVKVRAVLLTAVTRKALAAAKVSAADAGNVVSLVANDVGKVYDGMQVRRWRFGDEGLQGGCYGAYEGVRCCGAVWTCADGLCGRPAAPLPDPSPLQEFHYLWTAPIEALAILALVGSLMGIYVLPGVGVVALVLFLQYYFGWRVARNQYRNASNKHARYGCRGRAGCGLLDAPSVDTVEAPLTAPPALQAERDQRGAARHQAGEVLRLGVIL